LLKISSKIHFQLQFSEMHLDDLMIFVKFPH
jgi:hypothetical protein